MAANRTITEEPSFTILDPPKSVFRRKRFLLSFIPSAAVALAGVIALLASGTVALPFDRIVVIEGKLASKSEFFTDDVVRRILMANGIQVHITRDAGLNDLDYDFVFPSGQPAALLVRNQRQQDHKYSQVHKPFFSPIVLAVDNDRMLLYPEAQVQTVPEFIALTPAGDRLGELITNHPELRQRALELGFRVFEPDSTLSGGRLAGFLAERGIRVPRSGVGDTETFLPALPLLEKMITRIGDCPAVS